MATTYGPSAIDPAEWTCMGIFYQGHSMVMHDAYALDLADLYDNLGFDFWNFDSSTEGRINSRITIHNAANRLSVTCLTEVKDGRVYGMVIR